ncbi:helix-turn-helix transcriptional regulator [Polaromonas sp.]|uniref:helix-turn-helix transcriptional regulator n=1 Tax=Polaromonas sp. TaxID=1869339 RepID=UPI0013B6724C|nr:helix-turn-helix transcriptional regulator [Polaromonas sp.]NDP63796.1 helix-turn-helix transcriptional regulator [Polaromonas sp.]
MSSNILHVSGLTPVSPEQTPAFTGAHLSSLHAAEADEKNPFLVALGERVKALRARRGMTRKAVSIAADVSERHLANLEYGEGNASILVLLQVARALHCSLAELIGDVTTLSPEWLLIRELLEGRDDVALRRVRIAIGEMLGTGSANTAISSQVALIGLRGAGKSTLGALLAEDLGFPFVELSREIEKFAGCSVSEIQALYGMNAYRRYERRALEETIQIYPEAVIATPGGLVSDPATFNQLLSHCTTVWLQADPEDHMKRVLAQGDLRPMAASKQAMEDLKGILSGRAAFYSKAQHKVDTSAQSLELSFQILRQKVRGALQLPA